MEMLLSELTVGDYFMLIGMLCACMFIVFLILRLFLNLVQFIIDFLIYCFSKDKYKNRDFALIKAHRELASLRLQAKHASSETAFYLFYNRLYGAVEFACKLGYISDKLMFKILSFRPIYIDEKELSAKQGAGMSIHSISPKSKDGENNENGTAEECAEINPNK